jgi:hypothetical protein
VLDELGNENLFFSEIKYFILEAESLVGKRKKTGLPSS